MEQGMYTFSLHLCLVLVLGFSPSPFFPPSLSFCTILPLSSPYSVLFSLGFFLFTETIA
ncbi:hypothetical protein C8F04DRAFT_1081592, partial [Mycena alexandri]